MLTPPYATNLAGWLSQEEAKSSQFAGVSTANCARSRREKVFEDIFAIHSDERLFCETGSAAKRRPNLLSLFVAMQATETTPTPVILRP